MTGDCQVRFRERLGGRFPGSTRPTHSTLKREKQESNMNEVTKCIVEAFNIK